MKRFKEMKALVVSRGKIRLERDCPLPRPGPDDALVRILIAGICQTDLEIQEGYMGFEGIPGHEFVGIVEECRDKSFVGKRVVGEINLGCGRCSYCSQGVRNHCPARTVLGISNKDGVFAEYTVLPVQNLHILPDSLSDEEAVFVEPLAAAYEIVEQNTVDRKDSVCVLGDGKLGLLVAQVLFTTGCRLLVAGKHGENLSLLEKRGIRTQYDRGFLSTEFDIVVDCTGSVKGVETALSLIRPRGTIIMKTTVTPERPFDLNALVINEVNIVGSRCGPFPPAIKALESGIVDVLPLVQKVYPLDEGIEAFRFAGKKGTLKVLVKVS